MREELTVLGFEDLLTPEAVDAFLGQGEGSAFLVVNSVCGCAAGMARPAVRAALSQDVKPDRLGAVFAGQDLEATARARGYMAQLPPSSPSMALFKDGELVYFVPRHRIEGRSADEISRDLVDAFREHCLVPAG
jgi:putative YphP/YqiW family bacilliredoxin